MAQDFAKKFYKRKAWMDFRDMIYRERGGVCESCGGPGEEVHHITFLTPENIDDPLVTMNPEGVQLLCRGCHNEIHDRFYQMRRLNRITGPAVDNRFEFDANGNLVKKRNVTIVHGAPCAGKTTYVKEHKGRYDIVVDLDQIKRALLLKDDDVADVLPWAWEIRDFLYGLIERREKYMEHAWVIAMLPKRKDRNELAQRLGANLHHVDTDEDECLRRTQLRDTPEKHREHVKRYFKEYET